jgi:hypothetical protein
VDPFFLTRADCLAASKEFRRHPTLTVEFELTPGTSTVRALVLGALDGTTHRVETAPPATMPRVAHIGVADIPEEDCPAVFQFAHLADLAAVGKRRGEYVAVATNAGRRSTHFRIGPNYRAWIMPVCEPDPTVGWLTPEW